jgi:hypothetical protein
VCSTFSERRTSAFEPTHHRRGETSADNDEAYELGTIVQASKSFTARKINTLTGQKGHVWAADYFDRFMRDQRHWENDEGLYRGKSCERRALRQAG